VLVTPYETTVFAVGGVILIDTITLQSPFLTQDQAKKIENFCTKAIGIEIETGGVLYEFTRGQLSASSDSRISIQLKRDQLVEAYNSTKLVPDTHELECYKTLKKLIKKENLKRKKNNKYYFKTKKKLQTKYKNTGKKTMISEPCEPYVTVECSVHKAMLGHNVEGGPINFQKSAKWLIKKLQEFIKCELPDPMQWLVRRIDQAEVFNLGSYEAVQSWMQGMNHCHFPRRKVAKFADESIYVPSAKTTVKAYHKGPEFAKHDRKRLLKFMPFKQVNELQIQANNLLRIEVEIKSKKLRELFNGDLPSVNEITQEILTNVYNKEVNKLLREAQDPDVKEIFRTSDAVMTRLNELFKARKARTLYKTWLDLATNGEKKVKEFMSENTFYTHRRELIAANISWLQTDIIKNEEYSPIPKDFKPTFEDSRRLAHENETVKELLALVA